MPILWSGSRPGRTLRPVRRLTALLGVLAFAALLLPAPTAVAQGDEVGTITGTVTNGTTGEPQGGVAIRLLGGSQDDEGNFRQDVEADTITDGKGRFEFPELPAGQDRAYTLDARFDGGNFPGGVVTIASGGDVIEATQRVWNTTTDPRSIVIQNNRVFLLKGEDGASVIESFEIVNVSDEAYVGRGAGLPGPQNETGAGLAEPQNETGAGSAGPQDDTGTGQGGAQSIPSLSFSFPEDARREGIQIVDSDLDIPQLLDTETGISITSAVPPNETNITFAYSLRVNTGQVDLSRRALYPTLNLSVLAEPPFVIDSTRLVADGEATIDGITYKQYSSRDTITEGNSIPILGTARGDGDSALTFGALAAAALLIILLALGLLRSRATRQVAREPAKGEPGPPEARADLLVAIAQLDLEYRDGQLDEDEWKAKRGQLKARLVKVGATEPAS